MCVVWKVTALPIDRSIRALSYLREGNGWRSRIQHVTVKTMGEYFSLFFFLDIKTLLPYSLPSYHQRTALVYLALRNTVANLLTSFPGTTHLQPINQLFPHTQTFLISRVLPQSPTRSFLLNLPLNSPCNLHPPPPPPPPPS